MRRLLLPLIFACALLVFCGAQALKAQETPQQTAAIDRVTPLKWANTIIFAIGLGYLIYRYGPPFFNARSADIQKAIEEAVGLKIQGDFRRSEADKKMATLPAEIEKIRRQHDESLAREHERVSRDTKAEIHHIHANITAEIAALRLEGTRRIRQRTAESAIELAGQRLQSRLGTGGESYVSDFLHVVEQDKGRGNSR